MERASGVPGVSQQRAASLRMVVLAGVVALAVVLPLAAATAGPAAVAGRAKAWPDGKERRPGGGGAVPAAVPSLASSPSTDEPAGLLGVGAPSAPSVSGAPEEPRDAAQCGPELDSPEGLEAQTCVLTEGEETWARTYYRNGTDGPLAGVLTLMSPDGRSLQVQCPMEATDAPDACETPRRRTLRGHGAYTAVAEIASAEGNLLLRSGSNSPDLTED
ncbi:hypothetical protein I5Q34_10860 [Streptomyces sp. AV19]|uniref:hypothetical protein n=1 Tax=Streptomyces sp. AV19 TaxID=2793068 RepID=UPI0018FE75FA|nr:hypothetical protein [Streptomyces sp. AV19]MBH1934774.1 hypothetical protein [Streptomyces sp. AV19]MDG4530619.1 hypothetical protein [Streptomyces sp. AV19]